MQQEAGENLIVRSFLAKRYLRYQVKEDQNDGTRDRHGREEKMHSEFGRQT
jgi:hypothetical protein